MNGQLFRSFDDQLSLLGGHGVTDLGAVLAIQHHQYFEFLFRWSAGDGKRIEISLCATVALWPVAVQVSEGESKRTCTLLTRTFLKPFGSMYLVFLAEP